MNKSKLGRLTIVILIAVGVVVVPWALCMGLSYTIGKEGSQSRQPGIIMHWIIGLLSVVEIGIAYFVILYVGKALINFIKDGK